MFFFHEKKKEHTHALSWAIVGLLRWTEYIVIELFSSLDFLKKLPHKKLLSSAFNFYLLVIRERLVKFLQNLSFENKVTKRLGLTSIKMKKRLIHTCRSQK